MAHRFVQFPGALTIVPKNGLDFDLRRRARDHPGMPADPWQILADLRSRHDGVPITLDEPRTGGGNRTLLLYGRTWVLRLLPTDRGRAYLIKAVYPLRMRDHHRLAHGCLMVRPTGWNIFPQLRDVPDNCRTHWSLLEWHWQDLSRGVADVQGAAPVSEPQARLLDTLDTVIDAGRKIAAEAARSRPGIPYRSVASTGERRHGTHAVYVFHLVGRTLPAEGEFVQIRGEEEQRGQVTRVDGHEATVRFDQPVDWAHLDQQGELEVTFSDITFVKQREAVAALRTGRSANTSILSALVDHQVRPLRETAMVPTEELDADQRQAFDKALGVQDMLLVLGPPGTGKTRTITQIAEARSRAGNPGAVLVTAHTNRAVDNVLARLPAGLTAVRVGHTGSVTAEGAPYLLARQASDLRIEIVNGTAQSLSLYSDLEHAERWADELSSRLADLATAVAAQEDAHTKWGQARRAVGGTAQTRVEEVEARLQAVRGQAARADRRAARVVGLADAADARSGWVVLGTVMASAARLLTRRAATNRTQADDLRASLANIADELVRAEQALDLATRKHPAVTMAHERWLSATEQRATTGKETLTAAHAASAAASPCGTPPSVRAEALGQEEAVENSLSVLSSWMTAHMPLFRARAALLAEWHAEVSGAAEQLHPELIRYADVIAATCIGTASRPELSDLEFDLAIVDEAGQIGLADTLVPLTRARRVVLVGDHQQLPPFLDTEVERWGKSVPDPTVRELLTKSTLELLVHDLPRSHVVELTRQRRMPDVVARFSSDSFYGGRLRTAVHRDHSDLLFGSPLAFVDTSKLPPGRRHETAADDRTEEPAQRGYVNKAEASLLVSLALHYYRAGREWAVIVPYRAQIAEITATLAAALGDEDTVRLNVGTVDSFQGGERDVVLYGFTRSNPDRQVGFLQELRRFNVAFTRARQQLVLLGDMEMITSATDKGFRELAVQLRAHVAKHGEILPYGRVERRLADLGIGGQA
ncbi:DEAD/DEAH box helicase [Streptomyces sp. NPDC102365]|uniref:DEAD/DEAH box helicase n=1 Tax=Streptomyces sp. NPDC102365 TaxID=3366162 RepID=UPI00382644F4